MNQQIDLEEAIAASQGTRSQPMGPRFIDACLRDFLKVYGGTQAKPNTITAEHLVGYAFWWARERGVTGWSKARLKTEEGFMLNEPDQIATEMQEARDDG